MDIHEIQSQLFYKLTPEERDAYDQMWLENMKTAIQGLLSDLKRNLPTSLIEPTPLPEINKFIQEQVKTLRGE